MNWIDELIDTYSDFEPDFRTNIRGAGCSEISHLESLVKKELPHDYKLFLQYMGKNSGGVTDGYGININIEDIIEYYDDEDEPFMLPDNWLTIAYGSGPEFSINLNNGEIFETWYTEVGNYYTDSFIKLINQFAFFNIFIKKSKNRIGYSASANSVKKSNFPNANLCLDRLRMECSSLGLSELWLTDKTRFYAENNDMKLVFESSKKGGFWFAVSAKNERSYQVFADLGTAFGASTFQVE